MLHSSLTPPSTYLAALGDDFVTEQRHALITQLLAHAQSSDECCGTMMAQIQELLVRVYPGYCEEWIDFCEEQLKEVAQCHQTGEEEKIPFLLKGIIDTFAVMLSQQFQQLLHSTMEEVVPYASPEELLEICHSPVYPAWMHILEFYSKCALISDDIRAAFTTALPDLRAAFKYTASITRDDFADRKPQHTTKERKRVRPKRKKR